RGQPAAEPVRGSAEAVQADGRHDGRNDGIPRRGPAEGHQVAQGEAEAEEGRSLPRRPCLRRRARWSARWAAPGDVAAAARSGPERVAGGVRPPETRLWQAG